MHGALQKSEITGEINYTYLYADDIKHKEYSENMLSVHKLIEKRHSF